MRNSIFLYAKLPQGISYLQQSMSPVSETWSQSVFPFDWETIDFMKFSCSHGEHRKVVFPYRFVRCPCSSDTSFWPLQLASWITMKPGEKMSEARFWDSFTDWIQDWRNRKACLWFDVESSQGNVSVFGCAIFFSRPSSSKVFLCKKQGRAL